MEAQTAGDIIFLTLNIISFYESCYDSYTTIPIFIDYKINISFLSTDISIDFLFYFFIIPGFRWMCNKALMQTSAHELVKLLWNEVLILPKEEFTNLLKKHSSFIFKAAKLGNVEYLIILISFYPDLIWRVDKKNRSIFHIAAKYRQESVFKLIYEIGALKVLVSQYVDNHSNMLHLVGPLPPSNRLNVISGVPIQMQRELLWFKVGSNIIRNYLFFD
jgi:hypothetical protein